MTMARSGSSLLALPVQRPMATAMVFLGVVLLGLVAWQRLPVELLPALEGDRLQVVFARPGGEPELVEREILLPLAARVARLPQVAETRGEVEGSRGTFTVRFERGADLEVRELELQRIAADLARGQPRGTSLQVVAQDTSALSKFVMIVQVTGGGDRNALREVVDERVVPRLAAVPGVSQALPFGGGGREVLVRLDLARCAAEDVTVEQVLGALRRAVGRLSFLGNLEAERGQVAVVLDGRPRGVVSLAQLRVDPPRPVQLRHVAEITGGADRETNLYRIDGQPAVAVGVFKRDEANLLRLGEDLRESLDALARELRPQGLALRISFDGAETVAEQVDRLERLALSGFGVALLVLFLFLRRWRAVAVVAVAVPVSLLAAFALLYLAGQSLNLVSLFGLAVAVGMLVDNSVVVYEAVQRQLERRRSPDEAATLGVRRTARAILAASVTNAVVFLPVLLADFEQALVRSLLEVVALSILLPLAASLAVAVGLVPLLARRLAAPAALEQLRQERQRRERLAGLLGTLRPPDRARDLFTGLLASALRRPAGWIAAVAAAVLLTLLIALPWVLVSTAASQTPAVAEQVQTAVRLDGNRPVHAAAAVFDRLEAAVAGLEGVDRVESLVQEDGGNLTVYLEEEHADLAPTVHRLLRNRARQLEGVTLLRPEEADDGGGGGEGGGGLEALLGTGAAEVVLSGPDSGRLAELAEEVRAGLESVPEVAAAWLSTQPGQGELQVRPDKQALAAYGLFPEQVLPLISVLGREGQRLASGLGLEDGRELPIRVRQEPGGDRHGGGENGDRGRTRRELARTAVATPAGVLPLGALADLRAVPPPPVLQHHNGRREVRVAYRLAADAPATGPARQALEERITRAVQGIHRPAGYTLTTSADDDAAGWFKRLLLPVVLLLLLVLAMTFESPTLPLLVLLALPLTLLGALWALVLAGLPLGVMALVGALALLGLTVNPAILLVDRMQQKAGKRGGWSPGAAALAAVRERARPVLMTSATTVAGLWPLALATGRENEIWPPFATLVMGGLTTSTLLTLLVIPVGFVLLRRLDELLARLGPWWILAWIGATVAILAALIESGLLVSLIWQWLTGLLIAGLLLALVARVARRPAPATPELATQERVTETPALEVRSLRKVYGLPGPVGRAWRAPRVFAQRIAAQGIHLDGHREGREGALTAAALTVGLAALAFAVQGLFWQLLYLLGAAFAAGALARQLRRWRGRVDSLGQPLPGGLAGVVATVLPWLALGGFAWHVWTLEPWLPLGLVALGLAISQLGRRTAKRLARGDLRERLTTGRLPRTRTAWRRLARRLFGLDLPVEEVLALARVRFRLESGLVGLLGPNGAGKTTLLRLLAGILEPTRGRITVGGVPLGLLRKHLARWIGYLPQDTALPPALTAREYLEYYALLYGLEPAPARQERIETLLAEVGLAERADEPLGGFSGGMRQRVAIARTLLRLPPVILVDEPTVGLDPRERLRLRNLLTRLAEGRVVLFSTHVVEDVAVACPRVLVLARGRLLFDGPPEELAASARGRVWEARLEAQALGQVDAAARVADQHPEADGRLRLRLIAPHRPHPAAEPVEPSLEEAYLMLVENGGQHGGGSPAGAGEAAS